MSLCYLIASLDKKECTLYIFQNSLDWFWTHGIVKLEGQMAAKHKENKQEIFMILFIAILTLSPIYGFSRPEEKKCIPTNHVCVNLFKSV